jgi:hypothetical protein
MWTGFTLYEYQEVGMTGSQIWLALCVANSHPSSAEVVNAEQDLRRTKTDPPVGFGGPTSTLVVLFYFAEPAPENPARVIER